LQQAALDLLYMHENANNNNFRFSLTYWFLGIGKKVRNYTKQYN